MSHGDRVTALPAGFEVVATSERALRFIANEARYYYGTMFHPEVVHTPDGAKLLSNFVHNIVRLQGRLDHGRLSRQGRSKRSASPGRQGRVICGLSGGVDSPLPPC
jgi:GMP synthase (glutamine-hydrolysing)